MAWLRAFALSGRLSSTVTTPFSDSAWKPSSSVVASTYHDRSRVFGTIQVISTIAATAVLVVALLFSKDSVTAVKVMGWFIVIVTPLGILMASLFTPERIVVEHSGEKVTMADYWEMASWPEMRRIVAAAFCLTMGPGWMSAMYLFYFHDSRGFSAGCSRFQRSQSRPSRRNSFMLVALHTSLETP